MCVVTAAVAGSAAAATIANVSLAASVVGLGMQGYGMYQQQQAANEQAKYQAQVARNNAIAAEYEADYARERASEEAKKQRQKTQQILSSQRSAMGASGVVVDEGTFLDIQLDTVEQGKLDELAILHEGDKQAWAAEIGASNQRAQAGLYESSTSSPFMAAAPGVLTGAANTGMNYYRMVK